MKKISKAVSIILICSLCFTLFGGITIFADGELAILSGIPSLGGGKSYTKTTYNSANCYGYETSTYDTVHKWVGNEGNTYTYYNFEGDSNYKASDINDYDYLILTYNFITENIDSIHLETSSSKAVSSKIASDKWKSGKWNNIVFVCTIDKENTEKTVKLTDITYYLNGAEGVSLGASQNPYNVVSASNDNIRFRFKFNMPSNTAINDTTVYIGYHDIYATNTLPSVSMPSFDASVNADYTNGKVFIENDTKVEDILASDGCELSVYANGDYESKREIGDIVQYGDVITIKNANKALSYFDVLIPGIDYKIYDKTGESFSDKGITSGLNDEYKGKQKGDNATVLDGGDTVANVTLPLENGEIPSEYGYYVFDLMFAPENLGYSIALGNLTLNTGLRIGKWNTLRFIYDIVGKTVETYVNGVSEGTQAYNNLPDNVIAGFSGKAAFDNVYSYYSENLPNAQIIPTVSGTTLYKNVIYVDDFTVSEIAGVDGQISVYSDRTLSNELLDTDVITTGNVVVLESKDNIFTYLNAVNKVSWSKSEADIVVKVVYSEADSALKFTGIVPTETDETINFVATHDKSGTKIEQSIVCAQDGTVDFTLPLSSDKLGKRYTYTLTTEAVSSEGVLGLYTQGALDDIVKIINEKTSAKEISDYLSKNHLTIAIDNGDETKDFAYMGSLIYAMKGQGLYTAESFTKVYALSEGLYYVKTGKMTFEKFLLDYGTNLNQNYYEIFKNLPESEREILEKLYKKGLVFSNFDERFSEALWLCKYQLAATSDDLQALTISKLTEKNCVPQKYTSLNEYQKLLVFDSMHLERESVTKIDEVVSRLDELASGYNTTSGGSGSSGGSSGGRGGSSGGFINDKIVVITPSTEDEKSVASTVPSENNNDDIIGHWAEDSMRNLIDNGIMTGYEKGVFKPDNNISRAEFTKLIVVMLGLEQNYSENFNDVDKNEWYAGYIGAAHSKNIINGFEGSFNPDGYITRQDSVTIIYRVLESVGVEIKEEECIFDDKLNISDYAIGKVGALSKLGVIKGDNNTFRPKSNLTRAETATILYRIMGYTSAE